MLYDLICDVYKQTPDKIAATFVSGGIATSYCFGEIDNRVSLFEKALSQSYRPGDLLVTNLGNNIDLFVAYLTCAKLRLTIMPVACGIQPDALELLITDYYPKYLLINTDNWQDSFNSCNNYQPLSSVESSGHLFQCKSVVDCNRWHTALNQLVSHYQIFKSSDIFQRFFSMENGSSEWIDRFNQSRLVDIFSERDIPYIVTTTSGSTSKPKPILLGQQTKLIRALSLFETYTLDDCHCFIVSTPLYHSLAMRIMVAGLLFGRQVVVLERYSPDHWLTTVEAYSVDFALLVASQIKAIVSSKNFHSNKLKSIRRLVSSSATLESSVKLKWVANQNFRFYECYGASEVGVATSVEFTAGQPVNQSVGKSVRGVTVKIADSAAKPRRYPGEIIIQSAMKFLGYMSVEYFDDNADHCFHSGDLGYLGANDCLYYVGRTKETISVGGVNVYPADIESNVRDFFSNQDIECAAVAVLDASLGEVVALAVATQSSVDFNDLCFYLLNHLTDEQMPRHYFNLPVLDKTALGKLRRTSIRTQVQQLMERDASSQTDSYYSCAYL